MQGVEANHADFRGADMRQANLGGAYLEGAMMPPVSAEKPGLNEMLAALKEAMAAEGREDKTPETTREKEGREL